MVIPGMVEVDCLLLLRPFRDLLWMFFGDCFSSAFDVGDSILMVIFVVVSS